MELEHFDEAISYQAITFPFESVLMAIGKVNRTNEFSSESIENRPF